MTSFSNVLSKAPPSMSDDLAALDPHHFRDYQRWFRMMVKCKANGVSREEWIAWCQQDEKYASEKNAKWIAKTWDNLRC
jgi:Primase C terminal 2 (PriCT-2)